MTYLKWMFLWQQCRQLYCRYKGRDFKWWVHVRHQSGSDEVVLPGFFTSAASRPGVTPGSLSVLSTPLWDRGRYGSLRGSSRGRYGRRIGAPSPWGHKMDVRESWCATKKEKMCVRACVFMPEWMRLWHWDSGEGSNALFPSPEGWTSEDDCVCVCVFLPRSQSLVSWQMSLSNLLQCDVVILRQPLSLCLTSLGLAEASKWKWKWN